MRTIESREQALAKAEADLQSRSATVEEETRQAEAARKESADEAERLRRASDELAARERALSDARVEAGRQKEPEPSPAQSGFLAGLEAMASASDERRSRRDQR